jgi:sugar lactone lactonase YvrE
VTGDPVACTIEQTLLGDGVRWDARRDELLRVDILAGRVYRDKSASCPTMVLLHRARIAHGGRHRSCH